MALSSSSVLHRMARWQLHSMSLAADRRDQDGLSDWVVADPDRDERRDWLALVGRRRSVLATIWARVSRKQERKPPALAARPSPHLDASSPWRDSSFSVESGTNTGSSKPVRHAFAAAPPRPPAGTDFDRTWSLKNEQTRCITKGLPNFQLGPTWPSPFARSRPDLWTRSTHCSFASGPRVLTRAKNSRTFSLHVRVASPSSIARRVDFGKQGASRHKASSSGKRHGWRQKYAEVRANHLLTWQGGASLGARSIAWLSSLSMRSEIHLPFKGNWALPIKAAAGTEILLLVAKKERKNTELQSLDAPMTSLQCASSVVRLPHEAATLFNHVSTCKLWPSTLGSDRPCSQLSVLLLTCM